jgi:hypothetical protein
MPLLRPIAGSSASQETLLALRGTTWLNYLGVCRERACHTCNITGWGARSHTWTASEGWLGAWFGGFVVVSACRMQPPPIDRGAVSEPITVDHALAKHSGAGTRSRGSKLRELPAEHTVSQSLRGCRGCVAGLRWSLTRASGTAMTFRGRDRRKSPAKPTHPRISISLCPPPDLLIKLLAWPYCSTRLLGRSIPELELVSARTKGASWPASATSIHRSSA